MSEPEPTPKSVEARDTAYIYQARGLSKQLWDAINGLLALQPQWNALDYSSTLKTFEDQNEGLTAANIGAVVFDTANALETLMQQGHATNLARLL